MSWLELAGTIATVLAIAGTVLNNRHRRECFYIWLFSNSLTLAVHLFAGLWSLAARDVVFFILAVEGIFKWRNNSL